MSIAELPSNRAPRDNNISSIGADFERTPPQDLIAEQSVLGGMLLSKDAIADVIEIIRDRDFYRYRNPSKQTSLLASGLMDFANEILFFIV